VYSTLAAGGVYSKPMAITKVVLPNGKVDTSAGWGKPHRERVVSDGVAYTVTQVLEQNMLHGTGVGAYFGRPSAGKTGTTDNYADAWFCGYVPQLEATVWVGYPRAEIPMLSVHGIAVSGPTFPAQIWHYFMESATGNQAPLDFTSPKTEPTWLSWHGQWQYSGSYSSSSTGGGSSVSTTTASTQQAPQSPATEPGTISVLPPQTQPAPTTPEPAPAPQPTTPAPPPSPGDTQPAPTTPQQ
jgi:penicillin-binding protein 1A